MGTSWVAVHAVLKGRIVVVQNRAMNKSLIYCRVRLVVSSLCGQCCFGVLDTSTWWPTNHHCHSDVCIERGKC